MTVINRMQLKSMTYWHEIDTILFVGGDDGEIADDNDDAGSDQDFAG